MVLAADVHVVHQVAVADEQAVAAGGVAVGDQHALCVTVDEGLGLDAVAAAAHVGRHVGRDVADAGMEHEVPARAVVAARAFDEARAEAVVQRQHLVGFGLAPPQVDQRAQPLRLALRQVLRLGEVRVQVEQLPAVGLEGVPRRVEGHRLPAVVTTGRGGRTSRNTAACCAARRSRRSGWRRSSRLRAASARTPAITAGGSIFSTSQQRRAPGPRVAELWPHLAARRDALRPADDQRVADAAAVGVLLVAAQGRVRRHGPALRKVGVRVGPADVVDAARASRPSARA